MEPGEVEYTEGMFYQWMFITLQRRSTFQMEYCRFNKYIVAPYSETSNFRRTTRSQTTRFSHLPDPRSQKDISPLKKGGTAAEDEDEEELQLNQTKKGATLKLLIKNLFS